MRIENYNNYKNKFVSAETVNKISNPYSPVSSQLLERHCRHVLYIYILLALFVVENSWLRNYNSLHCEALRWSSRYIVQIARNTVLVSTAFSDINYLRVRIIQHPRTCFCMSLFIFYLLPFYVTHVAETIFHSAKRSCVVMYFSEDHLFAVC